MIDVSASKINVMLTKPFIERLCKTFLISELLISLSTVSLIEFLNFRVAGHHQESDEEEDSSSPVKTTAVSPTNNNEKQDYQRHALFFDGILRRKVILDLRLLVCNDFLQL